MARSPGGDLLARRLVRGLWAGPNATSAIVAGGPSRACPACGGVFRDWLTTTDRNCRTDARRFAYLRCERCALIRIAEFPPDLARYYAADYYAIPSPERLRDVARAEAYQLRLLLPHARAGRLLEIGPAWGQFAWQAKQAGFDVTCIEMDARCCAYLRDVVGVETHESAAPEETLALLPPQDAIVMWQVLEHLRDPWRFLEAAAANLTPGGALLVATPNADALSLRLMRAAWPHLDAPRHLWLVPFDTLSRVAARHGLKLAAVHFSDRGALRWSLFSWQRLLMNAVPARFQRAAYAAGTAVGTAFLPLELTGRRASSYTAVFQRPRE